MTLLEPDVWLAERLGVPSYRVRPGPPSELAGSLDEVGGAFLYAKIPAGRPEQVEALEDVGFHVVDTNVRFGRPVRRSTAPQSAGPQVRPARAEDEQAVAAIAENGFEHSRFHLDRQIARSTADRIKADWVRAWFAGRRGEAMLVAEAEGRVTGFCQLLASGPVAVIDLIAVARDARGQGTGRALVDAVDRCMPEAERIEVGTQVANTQSIRLYEAAGFRLLGAEYVLHRHPIRPGR